MFATRLVKTKGATLFTFRFRVKGYFEKMTYEYSTSYARSMHIMHIMDTTTYY
jgi:hypothetical protein